MAVLAPPSPDNGWQAGHAALLLSSFRKWTGRALLPEQVEATAAHDLYHASFALLSHDAGPDPRFTYANLTAQRLFEMPWAEIVGLPSRYSAEPLARDARAHLLERVAHHGYVDDYQGVRIARSGRRFLIRRAQVWNLIDAFGGLAGQAAAFADWEPLADPPSP